MISQRISSMFAAVFAALLLFANPALAGGSPHFIAHSTTASLSGTSLVVKFKEAGLAAGAQETIKLSAQLSATYQCVNKGGHVPSDPKKTTRNTSPSSYTNFTVDKNGNLTGSVSLTVPAASGVLSCPGGQTATLTAFTWSGIVIEDITSGAKLSIAGTFTGPSA